VPKSAGAIPAEILSIFGDAPLLKTENRDVYVDLLGRVAQDIGPKHTLEWLFIKNVVDQSWEIRRLSIFKAELIELERSRRIELISNPPKSGYVLPLPFGPEPETQAAKRRRIRREILELSSQKGSTTVFFARLDEYERIDKLLASAQVRLSMHLRDIQFYREGLAHLLKETSNKIIDGEYERSAEAAE
jgi:hypothetical protein